jgi:Na+-transporting NADH:ubiquinone oxidoreductase subunit F
MLTVFLMVNSFIFVLCGLIAVSSYFLKQSGKVRLKINDQNTGEIERGQTVFAALTRNEIYLPAACGGKGTCGRCMVVCREGGGPLTPLERLLLKPEEIEQSLRLACQIKVRENLALELPNDLMAAKKFRVSLEAADFTGEGIRSLHFRILDEQQLDFQPGQYVQIYRQLPHEQVVRAYSLASNAGQKTSFSLDVQYVPGGIMSTWLHRLAEGTELEISGPYGDMAFNQNCSAKNIVLVAGGVGLAPIRSILYRLLEQESRPQVYLFWGARHRSHLYAEEELKNIARQHADWLHFFPALSGDLIEEGWTGARGFIHTAVEAELPELKNAQAFICGPALMMQAATEVLLKKGLAPDQIKADPFDF